MKIKEIPGPIPGTTLKGWTVYQVANSDLVVGMDHEPVVAKAHGGSYSQCWGEKYPDTTSAEPQLKPWECTVAPWWRNRDTLDISFTADRAEGLAARRQRATSRRRNRRCSTPRSSPMFAVR